MSPRGTVATTLVGCGILIAGGNLLHAKLPTYRQIEGVFFLFLILSIGVEVAPEVTQALALLIFVTVFLENGGPFLEGIMSMMGSSTSKVTSGTSATASQPTTQQKRVLA